MEQVAADSPQQKVNFAEALQAFSVMKNSRVSWMVITRMQAVSASPTKPMNMFKDDGYKTPAAYIASLEEPRKSDIKELDAFIRKTLPTFKPYMIAGMLGYGTYHYKGKSGREGDWCIIGLSSRKNYISLYVCASDGKAYLPEKYKKQLPKTKIGKSCITFKKPEDIDHDVLKTMLKEAAVLMKQ